jgi:O-antigen/teichoic acid export membrane protein
LVPGLRLRVGRLAPGIARGYLALSALALCSQITDVIDFQWDKVVLSHFVSSSAVTAFQVATVLVLQGKTLALLPLGPLLVAVAELGGRDRERIDRLYRLLTSATLTVGSTVVGAMFVFAPSLIALWLGPDVSAAGGAARLFAVAIALNLLGAPLVCRALGERWHGLAAAGAVANMVVNSAVSLALIIAIGLNGALYGSIAGNLAGLVTLVVLVRHRLGEGWSWPSLRPIGIATVAAAALVIPGLDRQSSWPALAVMVGLYVLLVGGACVLVERPVRTLAASVIPGLTGWRR